jgi:ankyrin repeat protein
VVKVLLENGADVSATDTHGGTPLHYAAALGYKGVAEVLLANKANVNARDGNGNTPLQLAATYGHQDVAELLRKHGGHE